MNFGWILLNLIAAQKYHEKDTVLMEKE